MPGEVEKEFELQLSPVDRLRIRFRTRSRTRRAAELIEFVVVYRSLIEGHWRDLRKYDNAHGSPHVHLFDWHGETANNPLGDHEDSARVFRAARDDIKQNFKKIRERFIDSKSEL